MQLIMPMVRGMRFLFAGSLLTGQRARAAAISMMMISSLLAGLLYLPVPLTTHTEGVVWVPNQAQVFADTEGFVSEVLVDSGTRVR